MKQHLLFRYLPILILSTAFVIFGYSLIADDSYQRLKTLKVSLAKQREFNAQSGAEVARLRRQVHALRSDELVDSNVHENRILEKAARNELGMARKDEFVFIFEE